MYKTIKETIPYKVDYIEKTDKGLTNNNYIIHIKGKKYILRCPQSDIKHLFNPKNEEKVIKNIKNQDYILPVEYYKDGIQMVEYKEKLITFDDANKKTRIKKVAKLMKKFHNSNIQVDFQFDPLKQIYLYKNNIKTLKIDLNDYQTLFKQLKKHTFKPVLCHNDWVEGNICFINNKTYLIDFEYAGNNDPLFDIMSFITENDLSNEEKKDFLNEMFPNGISIKDQETLKMYRDANNLLWYLWAEMMNDFRDQAIYREISATKYAQLTDNYQKDLNNL